MKSLIESLKEAQSNTNFYNLSQSDLETLIDLADDITEEAKSALSSLKNSEKDTDDEEYIDIVIDGTPDRIKKNIQVLNISCNNFRKLPPVIYQLKNLRKLYLYNNAFSDDEKRKIRRSFPAKVQIHF